MAWRHRNEPEDELIGTFYVKLIHTKKIASFVKIYANTAQHDENTPVETHAA